MTAAYYEKSRAPGGPRGEPGPPPPGRQVPPALERLLERFPDIRRRPHPAISHFPIVFMLSASFFSFLYVVTGHQSFDDTAFYMLGAGLVTMVPAVITGLFTHWLNFPGGLHRTVNIEIGLSSAVMTIGAVSFFWHWANPQILGELGGAGVIYFILVLLLAPLVTANGYFGGMVTFPLEEEPPRAGRQKY